MGKKTIPLGDGRTNSPAFGENSPFITVLNETLQASKLRAGLIRKVEAHYGAKVVTFFSSFTKHEGQIADQDAEMIESLLAVEHKAGGKLILICNSPGGQGLAAERIVNICRSYSKDQFDVIVPHMAKSAATMIAFGASAIHMSRTAELGPVDPQFVYKDASDSQRFISAEEYVGSYNKLMADSSSGNFQRIEPFLQQLQRYDSRLVAQLESAQNLSVDISIRLLKTGQMPKMKGADDADIKKKIEVFLSQKKTSSHGRMITLDEAVNCGLNVKEIDLHSEIWNHLWELYVRSNWSVNNRCAKVLESSESSVEA
jgi:hypothetical protein